MGCVQQVNVELMGFSASRIQEQIGFRILLFRSVYSTTTHSHRQVRLLGAFGVDELLVLSLLMS